MEYNFTGPVFLITALLLSGCSSGKSVSISKTPKEQEREVQCYQEFAALKKLDPIAYETYRKQFENINKNYKIYENNKSMVDANSSEVMLTEINRKLSLVCVRIKNSVYSNMMNRANEMNKL